MVTGFEVHVDAAALADMERAEEAARAHVAAFNSAGGMTGAGGKAGLGKKRGIYKKKHQTAAQAAHAAKKRAYRAANRAVGAH